MDFEQLLSGKNPYDVCSSKLIDANLEVFVKRFLGLEVTDVVRENSVIKSVGEVRADHIYKVKIDGVVHILHLEDQMADDPLLQIRQLQYHSSINSEFNKHDNFPIISCFMVFLPKKSFDPLRIDMVFSDGSGNVTRRDVLTVNCFGNVDPKVVLDDNLMDLAVFLPFMMEFKSYEDKKSAYGRVVDHLRSIPSLEDRYNSKKFFIIFYVKRFGNLKLIKEVTGMTTEEIVKEFELEDVVGELREVWEQRGIEKGEQLGLKKGEQLGLKKGEQLGLRKGKVAIAKKMLARGDDRYEIADLTGLSVEEIDRL